MRKPEWLKTRIPTGEQFQQVNQLLQAYRLNTVCSSARCPNLAECWNRGTATIMLLGDTCTRHCRFCSVKTGNPGGAFDPNEPDRVAAAVAQLGLKYVVLTSVDRDDLDDLGAGIFARTVRQIKRHNPEVRIEILVPDFNARPDLIQQVLAAGPDVFAHNLETVERLTPMVRDPRAGFELSLKTLKIAKELAPGTLTKSGIMAGIGETTEELIQTLHRLRTINCDIVTIGQYLQPNRRCLRVNRYLSPAEFQELERIARNLGFRQAFAGPLVRSSFRAEELFNSTPTL
ncbi:MAG: lipoyl synthase [candidate division WOR-3 bacterium]